MRVNSCCAFFIFLGMMIASPNPLASQKIMALLPNDIIDLCASGKSNEELINVIQTKGLAFEVNLPVMQRLIDGGVSPEILQVILSVSSQNKMVNRRFIGFSSNEEKSGLSISTKPHGMTVSIDGQQLGVTPFFSNNLGKGEHHVRVEHPMFFSREKTILIDDKKQHEFFWKMEPREPIIHLKLNIEGEEEKPWSWIVRPRENCPLQPTLKLVGFNFSHPADEAYFKLDTESKKIFRGGGNACLEIFLWRGEVRRDMSIHDLPPCTARYYIADIKVKEINYIPLTLNIDVKKIDPLHPTITLESDTGSLITTSDKVREYAPYDLKDKLLEDLDLILK